MPQVSYRSHQSFSIILNSSCVLSNTRSSVGAPFHARSHCSAELSEEWRDERHEILFSPRSSSLS